MNVILCALSVGGFILSFFAALIHFIKEDNRWKWWTATTGVSIILYVVSWNTLAYG